MACSSRRGSPAGGDPLCRLRRRQHGLGGPLATNGTQRLGVGLLAAAPPWALWWHRHASRQSAVGGRAGRRGLGHGRRRRPVALSFRRRLREPWRRLLELAPPDEEKQGRSRKPLPDLYRTPLAYWAELTLRGGLGGGRGDLLAAAGRHPGDSHALARRGRRVPGRGLLHPGMAISLAGADLDRLVPACWRAWSIA